MNRLVNSQKRPGHGVLNERTNFERYSFQIPYQNSRSSLVCLLPAPFLFLEYRSLVIFLDYVGYVVLGCYQKILNPGPITKSSVLFMIFCTFEGSFGLSSNLNVPLKCNQCLFGKNYFDFSNSGKEKIGTKDFEFAEVKLHDLL